MLSKTEKNIVQTFSTVCKLFLKDHIPQRGDKRQAHIRIWCWKGTFRACFLHHTQKTLSLLSAAGANVMLTEPQNADHKHSVFVGTRLHGIRVPWELVW